MRWRSDRGYETVMSDGTVDPSLQRAIDALAVPGQLIGHRVISQRDELARCSSSRRRRYPCLRSKGATLAARYGMWRAS